jgi:hypothetical protein
MKRLKGAQPEKNSLSKGYGDVAPSSETEHPSGAPFSAFGAPKALLATTTVGYFFLALPHSGSCSL